MSHDTVVTSIKPASALTEDERALFKQAKDDEHVLETKETVFHAQGGGQPSDVGSMSTVDENASTASFAVSSARHGPDHRIVHLGRFIGGSAFDQGAHVKQTVDEATRRLHSRYHTAGHILGLATRSLSASATDSPASTTKLFPVTETSQILPAIEELKASHHPGMAFDEYKGLLQGEHKAALQQRCDEIVKLNLPVRCYWWEKDAIRDKCCSADMEGVEGLLEPDEEGRMVARVMDVVGLGAYPCGGTHVASTGEVGRVVVRNIKRSKGQTKVSYEIADALP